MKKDAILDILELICGVVAGFSVAFLMFVVLPGIEATATLSETRLIIISIICGIGSGMSTVLYIRLVSNYPLH